MNTFHKVYGLLCLVQEPEIRGAVGIVAAGTGHDGGGEGPAWGCGQGRVRGQTVLAGYDVVTGSITGDGIGRATVAIIQVVELKIVSNSCQCR